MTLPKQKELLRKELQYQLKQAIKESTKE